MEFDFIFKGSGAELNDGIAAFGRRFGFGLSDGGFKVRVESGAPGPELRMEENGAVIRYGRKIHFLRALGLLIESLAAGERTEIREAPRFDHAGAMFDVSRNAVLKVSSVKSITESMAAMGLDTLMLYTEDTYTLEGEPYFGYMRGRYTAGELRKIDGYADAFGIEVVPCIQTLAHLEQFLKWDAAEHLKDTDSVMLVGYEKTYALVDKMLKTISGIFRSKRIHIGMDEAFGLGTGRYLEINGFRTKQELMKEHLKRVLAIVRGYGLEPYIWSDMFFSSLSKTGDYYDTDTEAPETVPDVESGAVKPVYWDYYHGDEDFYADFIRKHKKLGRTPVFAGGVWTWTGMCTNYGRTLVNSEAALKACIKEGVKEAYVTAWNDDGAENSHFTTLLGLQLYAEFNYAGRADTDRLKKRVRFCTGVEYDAFMDLRFLDELPGIPENNPGSSNPSKYLLWQDLLLGLFDKHIEGVEASGHYARLEEKMGQYRRDSGEEGFIFEVPEKLCSVLKLKAGMGLRITGLYKLGDVEGLKRVALKELPLLSEKIARLKAAHRKQWMDTCKPFGWEVLDVRYGGLLSRIDTAVVRILDFVEGRTGGIEELEEERLRFCEPELPDSPQAVNCEEYSRITTANAI